MITKGWVGEIITLSTSSSPKLFLVQIQPHDYYVLITYCYILQRNKHWINSFQILVDLLHLRALKDFLHIWKTKEANLL